MKDKKTRTLHVAKIPADTYSKFKGLCYLSGKNTRDVIIDFIENYGGTK